MKTQISKGITVALLSIALWFCAGCDQQNVVADEATATGAPSPAVDIAQGNGASPAFANTAGDAAADATDISTDVPEAKRVQRAEVPENLKLSPAPREVVKRGQAGAWEAG